MGVSGGVQNTKVEGEEKSTVGGGPTPPETTLYTMFELH